MQFASPSFLFALTAISIPIIIHLFYFRRHKTVYYSSIKFLKTIQKDNQTKTILKHWLILACRILAIAALVLAFAQPFIPSQKGIISPLGNITGIYIDNSFSMEAEGQGGILLEEAKMKARQIAAGFPPSSKFMVLTNDFDAIHHQVYSREQLPNVLAGISSSSPARDFNQVVSRLVQNASKHNKGMGMTIFLISDFQKTTSRFNQFKPDSVLKLVAVPVLAQSTPNIFIDSCWFELPARYKGNTETMHVKIANNSDFEVDGLQVQLFINDTLKNLLSVDLEANAKKTVQLKYSSGSRGFHAGRVEISDFPVIFDNTWFFSYQILNGIRVNEYFEKHSSPYLSALFKNDSYISLERESMGAINLEKLKAAQMNLLNQPKAISSGLADEMHHFLKNGGNIVLIPLPEAQLESYNSFLQKCKAPVFENFDTNTTRLHKISSNDPLFSQVFKKESKDVILPEIKGYFNVNQRINPFTLSLLEDVHMRPMLTKTKVGKGMLYLFHFSCGEQNKTFVKSALFSSVVYNMAMFSQPYKPESYTIGLTQTVLLHAGSSEKQLVRLISSDNKTEILPLQRNSLSGTTLSSDQIKTSGHFYAKSNGTVLDIFSFNYNRMESDLSFYSPGELLQMAKEQGMNNFSLVNTEVRYMEKEIKDINHGIPLWKWFVLLAIFFLFAEMLLIRFWN